MLKDTYVTSILNVIVIPSEGWFMPW